jgi:hypothetical protein
MYSVMYIIGQVRFADAYQVLSSYLWTVCIIHMIKVLKITPAFTLQIKLHTVVLRFGRDRVGKSWTYFTKQSIGFCTKLCLLVIPFTFYVGRL